MQEKIELYPLKFTPILKSKIWGGNKISEKLGKNVNGLSNVGESWELSAVPNELSVVSEGLLQGKNIEDVIIQYKSALVGEKVYEKFGIQFPLLIKFIDANDYLSIQVHPGDDLARKRHNSYGKTEMWYVVDAEKNAKLIVGFNQEMDKHKYLNHFDMGNLQEVLNFEEVKSNDVFFLPAGRIHATGPGILFAEIQQTSDITYRIHDWDRVDDHGNERELHTEMALDAINFDFIEKYKTKYLKSKKSSSEIVACDYFTTNILEFNKPIEIDYSDKDSFVVFMAIEGHTSIVFSENKAPIMLTKGETILVPASIKKLLINPITKSSKLLEVYIEK
jgi:mannose-6-phosphate isomerase